MHLEWGLGHTHSIFWEICYSEIDWAPMHGIQHLCPFSYNNPIHVLLCFIIVLKQLKSFLGVEIPWHPPPPPPLYETLPSLHARSIQAHKWIKQYNVIISDVQFVEP